MTNITMNTFLRMPSGDRACREARKHFENKYGKDASVSLSQLWREWDRPDNENADRIWFACNWLTGSLLSDLAMRFAGQAMRYAGIEHAELTAHNVAEAIAVACSADPYVGSYFAYAAACAADVANHTADAARYAVVASDYAVNIGDAAAVAEQIAWCAQALKITEESEWHT